MMLSTAPKPNDFLARCQLYLDNEEQLLICSRPECGFALSVSRSQVTSHLRDKHQVPEELRRGLTQHLKNDYPHKISDPASAAPRPDGSPVHPMLKLHDGYAC